MTAFSEFYLNFASKVTFSKFDTLVFRIIKFVQTVNDVVFSKAQQSVVKHIEFRVKYSYKNSQKIAFFLFLRAEKNASSKESRQRNFRSKSQFIVSDAYLSVFSKV